MQPKPMGSTISISARQSHRGVIATIRLYWPLIKSLQTLLLLITGLGGYMSGRRPEAAVLLGLAGSLFLSIGGCTVLNMVFDRDIDARMERTAGRPLPSGRIPPRAALLLGLGLSGFGVGWSFALAPLYGEIVAAGLSCLTSWSIRYGSNAALPGPSYGAGYRGACRFLPAGR